MVVTGFFCTVWVAILAVEQFETVGSHRAYRNNYFRKKFFLNPEFTIS